jgi:hypothetical protein
MMMTVINDDTSLNRILVGCQEVSLFPDEWVSAIKGNTIRLTSGRHTVT